ncbi:cytochrome P450 81E8-like [Cucurbita maxima]|uniref:Cytochrome P450 81E8-like n=1 Tax=Cucurbita maxima TaxID=3661 RepID=A0A6J1J5B5_CUCMA|nr:cytochrome P450 81E8-like [Cucurbita maxima]XP_022985608.1 cytochrome P450 81E8-like [Cucurbita maxima]
MDFLSVFLLLLLVFLFLQQFITRRRNLPPSPPSVPIIGHLHLLQRPIHQNFHNIAAKYGPIFTLRFGSRLALIVSSLQLAEECFTKNDVVFANRPRLLIGKYLGYNFTTISTTPYGDLWRNLRRLTSMEVFSTARLNAALSIRKDEIRRLLVKLHSESFAKVELKSMFSELSFNVVMRVVTGKRYFGEEVSNETEAREFRELMDEISRHGGASNWINFMPILKWIGFGEYEKSLAKLTKRADKFMQKLVEYRRNQTGFEIEKQSTLLDRLLELQASEPEYYSDEIIKGVVLVLLRAGVDSTSVTMEWAMTQLLNNPEVISKAKAEIDTKIGRDRLVDESDLANLHYLQAIIYETFRLHPAAPMLLTHYSSDDCTVAGYDIPRGTMLMVNAWAIHRDPKLWDDPMSFRPERFLGAGNELLSNKLVPFGMGRRACPGETMAQRLIGLSLGLLIQCYEWKNVGYQKVDMTEGGGITIQKVQPLETMCRALPIMDKVLSNGLD